MRPAQACIWDSETLASERGNFPDVIELITGKFLRHSPEYYEWRLKDRRAKLSATNVDADTRLRLLDDIAVSLDRLGRHDEAIATAKQQLQLSPDRYETVANLGTFMIHGGDLKGGAEHIRRAITINPDAHFGRERWQLYLVEYLLRFGDKTVDELKSDDEWNSLGGNWWESGEMTGTLRMGAFPAFAAERERTANRKYSQEDALNGVMGMMRFSKHDSPILLDALACLLASNSSGRVITKGHWKDDPRQLAARAWLTAARYTDSEDDAAAYRHVAGVVSDRRPTPASRPCNRNSAAK